MIGVLKQAVSLVHLANEAEGFHWGIHNVEGSAVRVLLRRRLLKHRDVFRTHRRGIHGFLDRDIAETIGHEERQHDRDEKVDASCGFQHDNC